MSEVKATRVLPELELNKVSLKASLRNVVSQPAQTPVNGVVEMTPQQKAAVIFDMACTMAGAKSDWIAAELKVGKSLVSRWRRVEYRETPSWTQIVALGPDFLYCFRKAQGRIDGAGRRALLDLVQAVEDLADVMEG